MRAFVLRWTRLAALACALHSVAPACPAAAACEIHPAVKSLLEEGDRAPATAGILLVLDAQPPLETQARNAAAHGSSPLSRRERHATVIRTLRETAAATQRPILERLYSEVRAGTVVGYTPFWIVNAIAVEAVPRAILQLAEVEGIAAIEPNFEAVTIAPPTTDPARKAHTDPGIGIPPGVRAIRAPEVWRDFGLTGAGRVIAILDSGVDGSHPALARQWRGADGAAPPQQCWRDVTPRRIPYPYDYDGHGTSTMGSVVGLSPETGDTIGVAWGAKWIASNATDLNPGSRFDNAVLDALQWFADPDGDPETIDDVPDVLSNSWGISEILHGNYHDCDRRWWTAIDNLEAAGVVTIWGAGNGGPTSKIVRSPADRATTPTNAFSIGAADATNSGWPYPVAEFSARGPTGCDVPASNKIKPEVVAPGVNVYSSVKGGGYTDDRGGTSAATPHVAGIVALMRQANPELDVDAIKQILIATARDIGDPGEDNAAGWGFVDAYAAVAMAAHGIGGLEGRITNADLADDPVPGATIRLIEIGTAFTADGSGYFRGWAPTGTYRIEVRHPDFRADTVTIALTGGALTLRDFRLVDDKGPRFGDITRALTVTDSAGPYMIRAGAEDPSRVSSVRLHYRVNGRRWVDVPMQPDTTGMYAVMIAAQLPGSRIDYYIDAEDASGARNSSYAPAVAPEEFFSLHVTTPVFADDMESDRGWAVSALGDRASGGVWARRNPNGTYLNGELFQMEDDHTPDPGIRCYMTGNNPAGAEPSESDVDGGCTTLTSPVIDLSGKQRAFVTYYRWYGQAVWHKDALQIDVSSDGGATWSLLERVAHDERGWRRSAFDVGALVDLTSSMRFRFRACDTENNALIEAGLDDFAVETFDERPGNPWIPIDADRTAELSQNEPNPAWPTTTLIRFWLGTPAHARLEIYDASGRLVRSLLDRSLPAGPQAIPWDCITSAGERVPSGVYFYRLTAGSFVESKRLAVLR